MAEPLGQLKRLGARVATVIAEDTAQRAQAMEIARHRFLEDEPSARGVRAWFFAWRRAIAFGVVGALAVAAALVLTQKRPALGFEVDGVPGVARTWLAAPQNAALALAFSEGTRVRLDATARARVTELDAQGANLTLESGRLHAEIVHQSDSAWKVVAGPFTVRVTGTVFDVRWDPSTQLLAVAVERGSVSVRDASTGIEEPVHAQQTLHASAHEHRFAIVSSAEDSGAPSSNSEPLASTEAADGAAPEPAPVETGDTITGVPAKLGTSLPRRAVATSDDWRAFAKRGALREAFASAAAGNFTQTCAEASPSELLVLGDGARLAGNSVRAEEALLTLRRRYPGDTRRAAAAFALGKVAFDQRGAYEQAAAWFSTSLREQPGGPLARDAAGRLIEALRRADDSAGARRAARDYLEKYPEGPHADLARSVLR